MKDPLSTDKKVDILISALDERYNSIHKIRDRVQDICLWALGLLAASAGWLVQSDIHFRLLSALLIGGGILLAYWLLRYRYFHDLERGFKGQMRTAAKLERILHFYTPGYFSKGEETAYPPEWANAGTSIVEGNYFNTSYQLVEAGLLLFYLALILRTCV